jgi:hypothetical protein
MACWSKWYELAHDRLIINKSSNQRWRREQELKKRSTIKKVAIPSIITALIIGMFFLCILHLFSMI